MIKTIISGGQDGADLAGLVVGNKFGLKTGGTMPLGFKTLSGPKPEYEKLYGVKQHHSSDYAPRTALNVQNSDGTVRLAANFDSRGEICTLNAIRQHKKPYIDVDLTDPRPIKDLMDWIIENKIETLNVAGNAEQTFPGAFRRTVFYLTETLFSLDYEMKITYDAVLDFLNLSKQHHCILVENGNLIVKRHHKEQE